MCMTISTMSLLAISRLVVITLIPALPGIIQIIPNASLPLAVDSTSAGAFASCIGPLSACGALVMTNLGQQFGEEAQNFTKQMVLGIIGAIVISIICLPAAVLGIMC